MFFSTFATAKTGEILQNSDKKIEVLKKRNAFLSAMMQLNEKSVLNSHDTKSIISDDFK